MLSIHFAPSAPWHWKDGVICVVARSIANKELISRLSVSLVPRLFFSASPWNLSQSRGKKSKQGAKIFKARYTRSLFVWVDRDVYVHWATRRLPRDVGRVLIFGLKRSTTFQPPSSQILYPMKRPQNQLAKRVSGNELLEPFAWH